MAVPSMHAPPQMLRCARSAEVDRTALESGSALPCRRKVTLSAVSAPGCERLEKVVVALDAESKKEGERGEMLIDVTEVLETCRPCAGRGACVRSGTGRALRLSTAPGMGRALLSAPAVDVGDALPVDSTLAPADSAVDRVSAVSDDPSDICDAESTVLTRRNGGLTGRAKSIASGRENA